MVSEKDAIKEPIQKKKVAIYLRVSTDDQAEMYGLENQLNKIKAYLNIRSETLELASDEYIFQDEGLSGALEIEHRPQLKKMLDLLEYAPEGKKPFDLVIIYKVDRFARKLSVLLNIVERLKEHNVGFISCTESIDTDSPFGNAMLGILGIFAELERSLIQERTFGGRSEAVKKGKWMNDKYGYIRKDNVPYVLDEEAKVVRDIFDMFVNRRLTVAEITRELRSKEIPIPQVSKIIHKKITPKKTKILNQFKRGDKTIRCILSDDVYIGLYYYNKSSSKKNYKTGKTEIEEIKKEKWIKSSYSHMPIVDDTVFKKAQEMLENKGGFTNQKEDSDYLLSGLLKCACCQHLRRNNKPLHIIGLPGGSKSYYQCNGKNSQKFEGVRCRLIPLPKDELEQFVIGYLKRFLGKEEHFFSFMRKHKTNPYTIDKIEEKIQSLIVKSRELKLGKDGINHMLAKGKIDSGTYDNLILINESELSRVESEIKELKLQYNKTADEKKYFEGIKIVKEIIGTNLDKLFTDRKLLKQFMGYLISEIYVYGRDADENDRITGRKKQNGGVQQIPTHIEIRMRLPQEILDSLYQEVKKHS